MNRCEIGDCRLIMRRWVAEGVRVQMCVTSPPYWGLRDYGTAKWEGGSAQCDHRPDSTNRGKRPELPNPPAGWAERSEYEVFKSECGKCGAKRIDSQLGLEPTPEAYVANMVEVFRLVRELLADDGVLWLNLGDSYASDFKGSGGASAKQLSNAGSRYEMSQRLNHGLKPKDLVGIPWLVAFALRADGWYLRSDIIWSKPNPMPESVTDRPTKAHEYLFLLSKRERYYYDAESVAEANVTPGLKSGGLGKSWHDHKNDLTLGDRKDPEFNGQHSAFPGKRNRRTVWEIATQPYSGAHFATFPEALVEPCILAGSRPGDVVLDPFMGSGTVGQVAQNLGRRWIGCELNHDYAELQAHRTAQQGLELA